MRMPPSDPPVSLCVDLGKTSARMCAIESEEWGRALDVHTSAGAPGLNSDHAIDSIVAVIVQLAHDVDTSRFRHITGIAAGVAGALSNPVGSTHVAQRLRSELGIPAVVTSDVVTAHLGAFAGGSGTILIVGTGAVALSIDDDDQRLVDGWGPRLGDLGSGAWIGRHGLRAVLDCVSGRGMHTDLVLRAQNAGFAPGTIGHDIESAPNPARAMASFAPLVLNAAEAGDEVARQILNRAVDHLCRTATAANGTGRDIAIMGGLFESPFFRRLLISGLGAEGLRTVAPSYAALNGAAIALQRRDLPHERWLHRAE